MKRITAVLLSMLLLVSLLCTGFAEEELPVAKEISEVEETIEEAPAPEEPEPVAGEESEADPEPAIGEEAPETEELPEETEIEEPSETPEEITYAFAFIFDEKDRVEGEGEAITLTLAEGETFQLRYNATPSDASIQWESGDEDVATVSEIGEIEAIAAGEGVITATLPDGSVAELLLNIEKASVEIQIILGVEGAPLTLRAGETLQAPFAVSPVEIFEDILWTLDDAHIAAISGTGEVTGLAAGKALITASVGGQAYATLPVVVLPAWVEEEPQEPEEKEDIEEAAIDPKREKVTMGADGVMQVGDAVPEWAREAMAGVEQDQLESYDATKLATPTNVSWDAGENYVGSWDQVPGAGDRYRVKVYCNDVEVNSTTWWMGGWGETRHTVRFAKHFSESGAYHFSVAAAGDYDEYDGTGTYTDSDFASSSKINYVKPAEKLGVVTGLRWGDAGPGVDGYPIYFTMPANANNDGVDVDLYYYDTEDATWYNWGGWTSYQGRSAGAVEEFFDYDQMDTIGQYRFTVRAVSSRLDAIQNSDVSEYSAVFNLTEVVESVRNEVWVILERMAMGELTPKEAVEALNQLSPAKLASAMMLDESVVASIAELDAAFKATYGVNVDVNITADVSPQIGDASQIVVIGAASNASENNQALTMNFSKPSREVAVDGTFYKNAVQFDMDLAGAPNPLTIPVQITMPIPAGISPSRLCILHYYQDGSHDVIYPKISGNYASFVVTRFSTFVFAESNAEERVWGFIERLYKLVLGREPDTAADTWLNSLLNGSETGASAVRGFFLSAEFEAKNLSNNDFVTLVYRACMNREPGADEVTYWVAYLNQGIGRAAVLNEFVKSQEYGKICESYGIARGEMPLDAADQNIMVTLFVQRLYTIILNRQAERSGVEHWTNYLLNQGGDGKTTAYEFAFSQEFMNAGLSDDEFITRMYRALLNREPEASGMQAWRDEIALNGREGIFDGFADSVEFGLVMASYGVQ